MKNTTYLIECDYKGVAYFAEQNTGNTVEDVVKSIIQGQHEYIVAVIKIANCTQNLHLLAQDVTFEIAQEIVRTVELMPDDALVSRQAIKFCQALGLEILQGGAL